jgi:hypothetical protein
MYVGKLYISETDYAVLRTDYVLDEGEKHNFNMKFLLGIKVSENVKGTIIYKKEPKTTTTTCSMPLQKLEITLSQSPIKTYRINYGEKRCIGT